MRASLLAPAFLAASTNARFVMYADEWHPTRPTDPADRAGIDHVVLAFAMANATASFEPKVPISKMRSEFMNAKMMIAVGGWGDDIGFFQASKSDDAIKKFAADVATMLKNTGADGVDIDWEYPGGNGGDYKQVPNSEKTYQIDAFPKLLAETRAAIGEGKIMSIAVPGKAVDMIAFTEANGPKIWPSVDYINVMAYDLMNRRDKVTRHHTSVADSARAIDHYIALGAPPEKMNLGMAYYAKYFTTKDNCPHGALGCEIVPAEDPITGKDALTSGAWTFEASHMKPVDASTLTDSTDGTCGPEKGTKCAASCCSQYGNCGNSPEHCSGACQHAFGVGCTDPDVAGSWQLALAHGRLDKRAGGQYFFDASNKLFWTWDTPELIKMKFDKIVRPQKLGGVMAWSLGEDSFDWSHIHAMARELEKDEASPANLAEAAANRVHVSAHHAHSPSRPSPSKPPYSVVWVDGTPDGPAGDHVAESAAPKDFTVAVKPTADEAKASTPQQNKPLDHVQQDVGATTGAGEDLPFSPEYLAAIKAAGLGKARRRTIRGGDWEVVV